MSEERAPCEICGEPRDTICENPFEAQFAEAMQALLEEALADGSQDRQWPQQEVLDLLTAAVGDDAETVKVEAAAVSYLKALLDEGWLTYGEVETQNLEWRTPDRGTISICYKVRLTSEAIAGIVKIDRLRRLADGGEARGLLPEDG